MPPTERVYVDGGPNSQVPSVTGLDLDAAREKIKQAGFQVAEPPNWVNSTAHSGAVVGTSPGGKTIPGSIITIEVSNGIAPPPPPPPAPPEGMPPGEFGSTVIQIPGLPPITIPLLPPPP